jgi:TPR repeat protein
MSYCRQLPGWSLYEQAGQRYQAGDRAGAARLAQQAAEMGNPLAQLRLAMMYQKGDGVQQNAESALRLMRAAAAQGEPIAQVNMGDIYEYANTHGYEGYGLRDDWDMAAKMWNLSAAQGWADGEYRVGRAYQYGIGVPLDLQQAIYWYDKAAAQGHAQAKYFAQYLRDNHGFDGSSRDDAERAQLGPLMGRTMPFTPPIGTIFHHLSERLAFVHGEYAAQEDAKAKAAYELRARKACEQRGQETCIIPPYPGRH